MTGAQGGPIPLAQLSSRWSHQAGGRHPSSSSDPRVPIWSACSLPARAGVRRAARWDGIVPIYATETEFRPARPDEVTVAVADIANTRGTLDDFEVAVWTVADDPQTRTVYERAGTT